MTSDDEFTFESRASGVSSISNGLSVVGQLPASPYKTPVNLQKGDFRADTPESKGTSPLNLAKHAPAKTGTSDETEFKSLEYAVQMQKKGSQEEDFDHLSHLSSMPGSWIVKQSATFGDGEQTSSRINQDAVNPEMSEIVHSLKEAPSNGQLERDYTFESLKGEIEKDNVAAEGDLDVTNSTGADAITDTPSKSAKSATADARSGMVSGMVSADVPLMPAETPSAKSNFKHALENMLTNAFGWDAEGSKEAPAPTEDAAPIEANNLRAPRAVDMTFDDTVDSVDTTADTTANTVATDELPDSTNTSAATPGQLQQLNFDSEKSPAASAFTFLTAASDDSKRYTNPLFSNRGSNPFVGISGPDNGNANRASNTSSIYSELPNRSSQPLAAIPESRTFELKANQEEEESVAAEARQQESSVDQQTSVRSKLEAAAHEADDSAAVSKAKATLSGKSPMREKTPVSDDDELSVMAQSSPSGKESKSVQPTTTTSTSKSTTSVKAAAAGTAGLAAAGAAAIVSKGNATTNKGADIVDNLTQSSVKESQNSSVKVSDEYGTIPTPSKSGNSAESVKGSRRADKQSVSEKAAAITTVTDAQVPVQTGSTNLPTPDSTSRSASKSVGDNSVGPSNTPATTPSRTKSFKAKTPDMKQFAAGFKSFFHKKDRSAKSSPNVSQNETFDTTTSSVSSAPTVPTAVTSTTRSVSSTTAKAATAATVTAATVAAATSKPSNDVTTSIGAQDKLTNLATTAMANVSTTDSVSPVVKDAQDKATVTVPGGTDSMSSSARELVQKATEKNNSNSNINSNNESKLSIENSSDDDGVYRSKSFISAGRIVSKSKQGTPTNTPDLPKDAVMAKSVPGSDANVEPTTTAAVEPVTAPIQLEVEKKAENIPSYEPATSEKASVEAAEIPKTTEPEIEKKKQPETTTPTVGYTKEGKYDVPSKSVSHKSILASPQEPSPIPEYLPSFASQSQPSKITRDISGKDLQTKLTDDRETTPSADKENIPVSESFESAIENPLTAKDTDSSKTRSNVKPRAVADTLATTSAPVAATGIAATSAAATKGERSIKTPDYPMGEYKVPTSSVPKLSSRTNNHGPKVVSVSSSIYSMNPRTSAHPQAHTNNRSTLAKSQLMPTSGNTQSTISRASDGNGLTQTITASFSTTNANASSIASKSAVDSLLTADLNTSEDSTIPDMFDPDDASALFVAATYPFNATTLDSSNDAAICLSFNQNDIAFTYNLDESGWGEVILVDSLKRGWVPMNYFKSAVSDNVAQGEGNSPNAQLANSRIPLRVLFRNAGKFLLNPQSKPFYIAGHLRGYVFDVECFNGITDGVRKLLIDTDCISRSNTVVQRKPMVRRLRKKLLKAWSELLAKAKEYMHTMDPSKIEYLQLLTFDLLKRAIVFLDVWGVETADIDMQSDEDKNREELSTFVFALTYLPKPPQASYRLNEVYDQLVSYLSMISGRIDLVEHNIQGCRVLETVVGQVNLLVNEYVYLMKYAKAKVEDSAITQPSQRAAQLSILDGNASRLEQAVEELNSFVRVMIDVATRRNIANNLPGHSTRRKNKQGRPANDNKLYFYSREGGAIVINSCKMIGIASSSYRILKSFISLTKDFTLPSSRRYPNYVEMGMKPADFVRKCSLGLMGDRKVRRQVSAYKKRSVENLASTKNVPQQPPSASKRYSMFRAGNSGDMQMTDDGLDFLAGISTKDTTPFIRGDGQFEKLVEADDTERAKPLEFNPEDEILRSSDSDNKLLGASFRSLVALLTDETNPPDYFFISTFFLTFRIFANGSMLLEELISRFDVTDEFVESQRRLQITGNANGTGFSSIDSRIKSRRRLVCKAFKLWLESYWKPRSDYVLLAPLINFFNEGVKPILPMEAYQLLVIASKLVGQPPVETMKDKLNYYNNIDSDSQLIPRKISPKLHQKQIARMSRMNNMSGNVLINELDAYNSFMDDVDSYGLKEVKDVDDMPNSASRESVRRSLNLGLHLELNNSSSSEPILLTTRQLELMKSVVESYRRMLGDHWTKDGPEYTPIDTQALVDAWWKASQESWRCMNRSLILLNFNGLEIAKQLTLIESKMFCSIKVGELLNQNFTAKKLHLNLSPNIQRSILFTNLLSDYVIESVLQPDLEMKQRIHFFKCWLKVAISCLYLRNFNSLASIMTSLQSFLITRIDAIWEGLSEKYRDLFNYLTSIIHPEKNYHVYREKLRDFLTSNLEEDLEIPIVPYLSLFLQDLTFVVDGNPNYRDNLKSFLHQRLINIDKYFKITKIISDIQTLQVPYRDTGDLGTMYNSDATEQMRSETIRNLQKEIGDDEKVNLADMFDISGVPVMQELIFLEIWKVKQNNNREEDRNWKLSCAIQPRDQTPEEVTTVNDSANLTTVAE